MPVEEIITTIDKMTAEEYLQKCAAICADHEGEGCIDCPLRLLACGVPKESVEHTSVLRIVALYKAPPPPYTCPGCGSMVHLRAAKFCAECGREIKEGAK